MESLEVDELGVRPVKTLKLNECTTENYMLY